ncbi:MAG: alginate export family protein [Emcibacteraceae bacterium]|nr:alginate export family protein [Emcibacteraceae bacterium]
MSNIYKKSTLIPILLASCCTLPSCSANAADDVKEPANLVDAISDGEVYIDLRLRYEMVDQSGFVNNANATTLRTKLGYKTASYKGLSGTIEFENSTEILGGEYNNGINGKGTYPAIIDANHTEVNQAYFSYSGIEGNTLAAGRQAINLGNQRFVGTVGWRQNDQTFDAVALINNSVKDLTAIYGYVWNVNRIFGDDHPMGDLKTKTHVINVTYGGIKGLKVEGYGYLIDLDNIAVKGLNSKTFGIRASGNHEINARTKFLYAAEYANQTDYKANPTSFSVHYYNLEAGVNFEGLVIKAGLETLGNENGVASFKTPLATLHKFNGWTDKFLNTPSTGLRDYYGQVSYTLKDISPDVDGTNITFVYHKFKSDFNSLTYGSEIDISLSKKVFNQVTALVKFAKYDADAFATDTTKVWFQLATKF